MGLSRGLAPLLGWGTVASVGAVVLGVAIGLLGGATPEPGEHRGWLEVLTAGGPTSIVGAGLLALSLVPMAVAGVAAVAFARARERRYVIISAAVLVLLFAGLSAAIMASGPAGG